jgi:hypothetical protein
MGGLSLDLFKAGLKGSIRGNLVRFAGPEALGKKGHKRKRYTAALWLNGDASFRVHSFHPDAPDWRQLKDWVKQQCGIRWEPKKRKAPQPSFAVRNQYFGESLALCHDLGRITAEQFERLIIDLRPKDPATRSDDAHYYGMLFGFHGEAVERALALPHSTLTASERAELFQPTYEQRQRLKLKRTRWAGATAEDVERARRDRYNAKRRAVRAKARAVREIHKSIRTRGVSRLYQVTSVNPRDLLSRNLGNLVAASSNRSRLRINTKQHNPRTLINTYRKQPISLKPLRGVRPNLNSAPPNRATQSGKITRAFGPANCGHHRLKDSLARLGKAIGPP